MSGVGLDSPDIAAARTSRPYIYDDSNDKATNRLPTSSTHEDVLILGWNGPSDLENPVNWTNAHKWLVTSAALFATLIVCWNGTSIAASALEINADFNISDATFPHSYWPLCSWTFGGAVFVILLLPIMEDVGVRMGFLVSYVFFLLMIIPQALATNFATLIVTRFFSGGCVSLLANTIASVITDVWETDEERSIPVSLYILMYLSGNTLGLPVFGGVTQYLHNWRWIFYIQLIIYGSLLPFFWYCIQETRSSVILRRRAKRLRKTTGRKIYAEADLDAPPLLQSLTKSASRPLYLLFTEPLLMANTLWSAFCFGTVFLFTQSTAIVFMGLYGWEEYSVAYVNGAVVIGEIIGWFATLLSTKLYLASASRNTECPGKPIPEARLYVSIFGSFFGVVGGMFVCAWTSYPSISWIAPAIGLAMVGFGIQTVVSAVADYILDAYAASNYAASAVSAVAAGENFTAAFLPFAANAMYGRLGFQWASSLLAFLAIVLSMAPVVFVWKGRVFRERSPFMQAGGALAKASTQSTEEGVV